MSRCIVSPQHQNQSWESRNFSINLSFDEEPELGGGVFWLVCHSRALRRSTTKPL